MKDLPLRYKLAIWSVLVVALTLLPSGFITAIYHYLEQTDTLDMRLRQSANSFLSVSLMNETDLSALDKQMLMQVLNPASRPQRFLEIVRADGSTSFRTRNLQNGELRSQPQGFSRTKIKDLPVRVYTVTEHGITVYFAMDMVEIYEATLGMAKGYLVALPILILGAFFGGHFIARKALAPVQRLADTTERINAQQLDLRLPTPKYEDEIGRLSEVLNNMFDRLDVSFKQAIRFSADASHELKTPLAILQVGIEDILNRKDLTEGTREAVTDFQDQTSRLISILENLLFLSRIDAGQLRINSRLDDVAQLVRNCVEDAQMLAQAHQDTESSDGASPDTAEIRILHETPDHLPAQVDKVRLTQILLNLLENAIKYNIPGGEIQVTLRQPTEERYTISVANTSQAVLSLHRQRVFQRFFRMDQSRDRQGHGLGLSLVVELSRAMGGDIQLVRSDGHWTEFMVTLPVTASGDVAVSGPQSLA